MRRISGITTSVTSKLPTDWSAVERHDSKTASVYTESRLDG
jgi:hypothetical protein